MGGLPLDALLYDPTLRYLLVVLRDEGPATREAFLGLKPNNAQLGAAHTGGQLVGVIVSMAGARARGGVVCRWSRAAAASPLTSH